MFDLTDNVAVVTGGASGNGRAIALAFADHGAAVVVADLQAEPREGGTPTHEVIAEEADGRAEFVECDVTSVADLEAAVDAAEAFGGVDTMVNNAGIIRDEVFTEVDEAAYEQIMDVNVKGAFFGSQVAVERMAENGGGSIVNISSTSGLVGSNSSVTYSTSKGAVRLMTYAIAAQYGGAGIRANAIHPGAVRTELVREDLGFDYDDEEALAAVTHKIPDGRLADPDDIANAAVYLASDYASHVNAESLVVDGGQVNTDTPAGWGR
ncbi:MAG: SDR family oxidoreductase [Haloarculaceae archaeon]